MLFKTQDSESWLIQRLSLHNFDCLEHTKIGSIADPASEHSFVTTVWDFVPILPIPRAVGCLYKVSRAASISKNAHPNMDAPEPETTAFDAMSAQTNRVMRVRSSYHRSHFWLQRQN